MRQGSTLLVLWIVLMMASGLAFFWLVVLNRGLHCRYSTARGDRGPDYRCGHPTENDRPGKETSQRSWAEQR
jgi:hypothetical protein